MRWYLWLGQLTTVEEKIWKTFVAFSSKFNFNPNVNFFIVTTFLSHQNIWLVRFPSWELSKLITSTNEARSIFFFVNFKHYFFSVNARKGYQKHVIIYTYAGTSHKQYHNIFHQILISFEIRNAAKNLSWIWWARPG